MKVKITDGVLQTLKRESRTPRGATTLGKLFPNVLTRSARDKSYKDITSLYVGAAFTRDNYQTMRQKRPK